MIYQISFQVSASAENALTFRKDLVPTFRLRVNDSSFSSSVYKNIESIDQNSRIPTFNSPVIYDVWYAGSSSLAGETLTASFDYMLTASSFSTTAEYRDAADISLVIEVVEVTSYEFPNSDE